ncbi:MAG: succinate dehydrogenase, partial [Candidatus Acidiferrales bacterium]
MAESQTVQPLDHFQRRDSWWFEVALVAIGLGIFVVYATLRAFEGHFYSWGPYLSPFYSPLIDPLHR